LSLTLSILLSVGCRADDAGSANRGSIDSGPEETQPTILVVGDSLSSGYGLAPGESWVTLLQNQLTAEGYGYTVVNASISGDTTGGGLRRLPRALEIHRPEIVVIELGGNDGLRGTPIMVIRSNIDKMIRLAEDSGAEVVLAGMVIPPNYGEKYATGFTKIYSDLAENNDAALVPFFMDGVALDPSKMLPDQIHPNAAGQPILLDNLWPVLVELL